MKPLKLVISAFGSYLEPTEIDFSKLGSQGIYLITGNTGSGKSTIFEAISYALYGETVSGTDRDASMLRNTAASDDLETYVELDFEEKGKVYHIRRSPTYLLQRMKKTRKKKDGTDGQDEHAKHSSEVLLQDTGGGLLLDRDKEVNEKIYEITGIAKENFKKIAMIAQGDFMRVIREDTQTREKILTSVFDTKKYVQLAEKLQKSCSAAKSSREMLQQTLLDNIHQVRFRGDSAYAQKAAELKDVVYLSPLQIDNALEVLGQLMEEDQQLMETVNERLAEKTERNGQVKILIGKAEERKKTQQALTQHISQKEELLQKLPEKEKAFEEAKEYPAEAEKLGKTAEVIRAGLSEYDTLDLAVKGAEIGETELKKLEGEYNQAAENKEKAEKGEQSDKERLAELEGTEDKKAALEQEYDQIVSRGKTIRTIHNKIKEIIKKKSEDLSVKEKSFRKAKEEYDKKNRLYICIYEDFINNQAGILAGELKAGMPCPVCGSLEHPAPAKRNKEVDKAQVDTAKNDRDTSDAALQKALTVYKAEQSVIESMTEELQRMLAEDTDIVFTTLEDAAEKIERILQDQLAKAVELGKQKTAVEKLVEEKKNVKNHRETCLEDIRKYSTKVTELTGQLHSVREKLNSDKVKVEELRKKLEFPSKESAERKIRECTEKAEALKKTYEAVRKALEEHKQKLSDCQSVENALRNQLEEGEAYDSAALDEEEKALKKELEQLNETRQGVSDRLGRNKEIIDTLTDGKDNYIKKDEYYHRCEDLYRTIGGGLKGKDNIKFLSYVLAAYFDRVLQRANIRMIKMSGGKYSLVRAQGAGDKRKNTGLDVIVRDKNGTYRAANTLSGGESFTAALSLALGLSDEVQSTNGGIRLETMFIDEGFGSLDENTLDKALEVLSTLSTGNSLIGIISHVGKLKEIITRRISVTKDDNGVTHAKVEL